MKTILPVSLLFCLTLAAGAQAVQTQSLPGHVPAAVAGLTPLGRLPATHVLLLAIGLPLRNKAELTNLLQSIYDPASPAYHHYLTPAQFAETFGPTEEDYQAVAAFAKTSGLTVTATHSNRVVLDVTGPVSVIEKAFHLTLRTYSHPRENRLFFAPDVEPTLALAAPVLHIGGLDNYLRPHPMLVRKKPHAGAAGVSPANGSAPDGGYMGKDFRAAYVPGLALTGAGQSVGLLEFDGYFPGDIPAYTNLSHVPAVPLVNVLLDGFDGSAGSANDEVALDIDMATCMAPGLTSIIVYEGELTDSILNRMATDNLAKQLSASWTYPIDATSDQDFLQFAAQGQSFFNASGDSDAYTGAIPTPSDDPNIISVGGTSLTTTGPGGSYVSETVWNWGNEIGSQYDGVGGSGGISTTYTIPPWQQGVGMSANGASPTMRNIPDVALTADNITIIANDGQSENLGGTSCATPLWAGYIALANEQAVAGGHPTLGFINPAIYAIGQGAGYASAFHDITTGDNTWSRSPSAFYAVPGYDLCTGWGTPAGAALINTLAPLDVLLISPSFGFTAYGGVGGPFTVTSQSYTLTNSGPAMLDWSLANSALWLNVFPEGGSLAPAGSSVPVTVELNAAASNLAVGSYTTTLWFTNLTDGVGQSRPVTLNVIAPPIITNSPASQAVLGGATVLFTVGAASAGPLTFQWRQNGVSLSDGLNLSGSATASLTITNVVSTNVGSYSVVVANAAGALTNSPPAVLTITPSKPVITSQPANQAAIVGTTAAFSVAALGNAPISFQWYFGNTTVTNATNATLLLPNVTSNQAGTYSVFISNSLGSTNSVNATLLVLPAPLVQNGGFETGAFDTWTTSGNFDPSVCLVTTDVQFVHSGVYGAALGPVGLLGYISQAVPTTAGQTYEISCWLTCDGEIPNEFSVSWNGSLLFDQQNIGDTRGWTNLQFLANATDVNMLLSIGFRDDPSYLGLDDISVLPISLTAAPVIISQPAAATVAPGAAAVFSVSAGGKSPLSYFWRRDGAPIAGATNSTYTTNNVQPADSGTLFSCLVSNSLGTTLSANADLTVIPPDLVQNGGFETGDFTAWTTSGNDDVYSCWVDEYDAYSGLYGAGLGPVGSPGYLSQTLSTTAGQNYLVSCWLFCDGETPNEFMVFWGGATLFDQTDIGYTGWTNLQFQAAATSAKTPLTLGFRDDPSWFSLDDVSVLQIPPPRFQPVSFGNGVITFTWGTQAGQLYQLQYTTNLTQNQWVNLGGVLSAGGSSITTTDTTTGPAARFYRIVLLPP
jgi:hypothetical protein